MAPTDMEQRHGQQRSGLEAPFEHRANQFAVAHGCGYGRAFHIVNCLADGTMGRGRALGLAAGSRGVHDHGQVGGINRYRGWSPAPESGHQRLQAMGILRINRPGDDRIDTAGVNQWRHAVVTLLVAEHQPRAAVLHRIGDILRCAPAVDRHDHPADGDHPDEDRHPLRVISHRQCHPCAGLYAPGLQRRADGIRRRQQIIEAAPLALVDQELPVTVLARRRQRRRQVRRRPDVVMTIGVAARQFIGGARSGQLRHDRFVFALDL